MKYLFHQSLELDLDCFMIKEVGCHFFEGILDHRRDCMKVYSSFYKAIIKEKGEPAALPIWYISSAVCSALLLSAVASHP